MILWAPETKEHPCKPVHVAVLISDQSVVGQNTVPVCRRVRQVLAAGHQAELYLWNQSDLFLLFSIWLSGRFLFITWPPLPPHPLSPRNDLLLHLFGQCYITRCPVIMMYWSDLLTLLKAYVCLLTIFLKLVGLSRGFSQRRWGIDST